MAYTLTCPTCDAEVTLCDHETERLARALDRRSLFPGVEPGTDPTVDLSAIECLEWQERTREAEARARACSLFATEVLELLTEAEWQPHQECVRCHRHRREGHAGGCMVARFKALAEMMR